MTVLGLPYRPVSILLMGVAAVLAAMSYFLPLGPMLYLPYVTLLFSTGVALRMKGDQACASRPGE
ncbi:hypothetical protein KEM60_01185 [Austwickia sp. TVS 96-490-7B]|uniref:hypothetical protein n=1 Tax=Austwickia sp. TVS 96-490-7B TaxID=2830843 RepID=UPI001C59BAD7|nr:hypothetical protein [Austwickia sp. TVS 96-490-7B]MBW3084994.1 hypothetical protein [Austwickia sp. TVS 96-490-7B]